MKWPASFGLDCFASLAMTVSCQERRLLNGRWRIANGMRDVMDDKLAG
jgi:hypothetical protein